MTAEAMETKGPFGDPLFTAMARHHGCHDEGGGWHAVDLSPMHSDGRRDWARAGARGIESDRLRGVPAGMPRFRFARDEGGPALMIDGERYIYSNRHGTRRLIIQDVALPETMLAAAQGRRLSDFIDLPGARDETIASAVNGPVGPGIGSLVLQLL